MQTPASSYPILPIWGLAALCASICWWLDRAAPSSAPVEAPHIAQIFTAPSARYRPASCGLLPLKGAAPACAPAWSLLVGRLGDIHPGRFADPDRDRSRPRGL